MTIKDNTCAVGFNMQASHAYDVQRVVDGQFSTFKDTVAEEVPIAMVYNGVSHAVMLATPADLKDFALGFSLTEGILDNSSDLYGFEEITENEGIALHLEISAQCFAKLKEVRRSLTGRTGCGLCGTESLEKALRLPATKYSAEAFSTEPLRAGAIFTLNSHSIQQALSEMQGKQRLQAATGATHACAWANLAGEAKVLREDVGRHNALDKLIGALVMLKNLDHSQGFIVTTSRASVEMVQKTIAAGVKVLVAVSAPTGLAIRVAESYGITLIGFARENRFVVYTHANRVQL